PVEAVHLPPVRRRHRRRRRSQRRVARALPHLEGRPPRQPAQLNPSRSGTRFGGYGPRIWCQNEGWGSVLERDGDLVAQRGQLGFPVGGGDEGEDDELAGALLDELLE